MFFKQFFEKESSTYTYMLGCEETRGAVLIDPVASDIEIYAKELEQHQFTLIYTLDTHVHADHITAADLLRERFHCKSVLHRNSEVSCGDILITDGCMLKVGNLSIEARYTPGHTNACTSYLVGNMIFTGDALLIDGCGQLTSSKVMQAHFMTVFINNFLACLTTLFYIRDTIIKVVCLQQLVMNA